METGRGGIGGTKDNTLQWSHNFCVVETMGGANINVKLCLPSMEPQLLRCGNPQVQPDGSIAYLLLQWSHNFCVVETRQQATLKKSRKLLQWILI